MSDIVRIELGNSIFEAEVIAESLKARGFAVQLLRMEHPETGGVFALGGAALLVRSDEEAAVRSVLSELGW